MMEAVDLICFVPNEIPFPEPDPARNHRRQKKSANKTASS